MGLFGGDGKNKKTILIVDDEKHILDMLAAFLQLEGYLTMLASDAVSGLEIALNKKPDLMIIDVAMFPLDGNEMVKRVRANPGAANIPIIMMTAVHQSVQGAETAFLSGANAFMMKPLDLERLKAKIKSLLKN